MDHEPQYSTPDGSQLRIWRDAAKNNFLSDKLGRPVFDDAIFVEVISPGSKGSTPVFEVKRVFSKDMNHPEPLFGSQYEQFKKYVEDFESSEAADKDLTGTPLKEWNAVSRTLAASLRASNIFTVEALSELSDEKLTVVGPDGRSWRDKAKAYLLSTKDAGYVGELAIELATAKADNEDLRNQVAALAARLDAADKAAAEPPAAAGKAAKTATTAPSGGTLPADII